MRVSYFVLSGATLTFSINAQSRIANCVPASGPPYLQCQVDTPAKLRTDSPLPIIPENIRDKQEPTILATRFQFVVDTTGRAEPGTVKMVESSDGTAPGRFLSVLPRMRFEPAKRGGIRVRAQLDEWIVFVATPGDLPPLPARHDTTADGIPRMIIGQPLPDSAGGAALMTSDILQAQSAAILHSLDNPIYHHNPKTTACAVFSFRGQQVFPDSQFANLMSTEKVNIVSADRCPRTYASMVYTPGMPRPPVGHVDPYRFSFQNVHLWSANQIHFQMLREHGMGRQLSWCSARRNDGRWVASCRNGQYSVS